jgi:hypothetical protein
MVGRGVRQCSGGWDGEVKALAALATRGRREERKEETSLEKASSEENGTTGTRREETRRDIAGQKQSGMNSIEM